MDEEVAAYLGKIALLIALIGASAYCVVHGKDDSAFVFGLAAVAIVEF